MVLAIFMMITLSFRRNKLFFYLICAIDRKCFDVFRPREKKKDHHNFHLIQYPKINFPRRPFFSGADYVEINMWTCICYWIISAWDLRHETFPYFSLFSFSGFFFGTKQIPVYPLLILCRRFTSFFFWCPLPFTTHKFAIQISRNSTSNVIA